MTVNEIIARFDEERINQEPLDIKLVWLKEIEELVLNDVVMTHENDIEEPEKYFDEWSESSELIVPSRYADVYINYLDMKMQLKLNQLKKYNNASTLFNNAYITYQQWYNRTHIPLKTTKWMPHGVI